MKLFYEPTAEHIAKLSGSWTASYSGGKDSTSLVTWIEWLRRTKQIECPHPKLVQSDTEVEYALLQKNSQQMMALLCESGWECVVVKPLIHEKLYNRIIGIGNSPVHPGGRKMRWCTRATKIDPMERWRKTQEEGLILTGVRYGESVVRDEKLMKHKPTSCSAGGECGLPEISSNTYGPIINWTLCEVIDWLNGMLRKADRQLMADVFCITGELLDLYDVKYGQENFDGTRNVASVARFGCIGCPAIEVTEHAPKATVLRQGVDSPLNELYSVMFDARRLINRCAGFDKRNSGKWGYGPVRMAVRKQLFARVMDIQRRAGIVLITPEDERFIKQCWRKKVYPRGWSEADEATVEPEPELIQLSLRKQ